MRVVGRIAVGLVALGLLAVGGIFAASELGGEVVVLHTFDASGRERTTRLWVVDDDDGRPYLRSGVPTSAWFVELEASSAVVVERAGESHRGRALAVRAPGAIERVNDLMRAKYGWADRLIGATRDGSASLAVRLDLTGSAGLTP